MCYHRHRVERTALREEAPEAEPTEATDEAEPEPADEREPLAPAADD